MKHADIQKIRQLLQNAQIQVGATIEWAKYPRGAEEHGNKALNFLEEALALLPWETCETCEAAHTTSCPNCQSKKCICCEEITEENVHLHRNCGK